MVKKIMTCTKCGYEEIVSNKDHVKLAKWHHLDGGRVGFGSALDGVELALDLCEKCTLTLINSCVHKNEILHNEITEDQGYEEYAKAYQEFYGGNYALQEN